MVGSRLRPRGPLRRHPDVLPLWPDGRGGGLARRHGLRGARRGAARRAGGVRRRRLGDGGSPAPRRPRRPRAPATAPPRPRSPCRRPAPCTAWSGGRRRPGGWRGRRPRWRSARGRPWPSASRSWAVRSAGALWGRCPGSSSPPLPCCRPSRPTALAGGCERSRPRCTARRRAAGSARGGISGRPRGWRRSISGRRGNRPCPPRRGRPRGRSRAAGRSRTARARPTCRRRRRSVPGRSSVGRSGRWRSRSCPRRPARPSRCGCW